MKRELGIGIVAVALSVAGVNAQGRNFSGTWTVDAEKTMAAGGGAGGGRGGGGGGMRSGGGGVAVASTTGTVATAGGGGGGGAVMARSGGAGGAGGTVVALDTKSFSITNGTNTTTYALDGSVTDLSNANRKATAKASWQGDKLAIETTAEGPNGPVVTHASWYIEGEWLVRENSSAGPDGTPVVRKTYFKKG